jgi:hypothetical protein
MVSPLARLLDFLSERYNLLFLVSGGNVPSPLTIPGFNDWTAFEQATGADRERAVLTALNAAKLERTILSSAESLNAITIGAQHHDYLAQRVGGANAIDPIQDNTLATILEALSNICSKLLPHFELLVRQPGQTNDADVQRRRTPSHVSAIG